MLCTGLILGFEGIEELYRKAIEGHVRLGDAPERHPAPDRTEVRWSQFASGDEIGWQAGFTPCWATYPV